MDCPICKDSPMITLELNEIEVDYCLECKGIWLDEGELEMLLDTPQQALELLNSFKETNETIEEFYKCPICLKKMQKIAAGTEEMPLVIDKCSKNHGLWFDKGELPKILSCASLDPENKIQKLLKDMFAQEEI